MLNWGGGRQPVKEPPVLDTDYLARLEGHIGRDTVLELLSDGLIELCDRLGALARHAEADEREEALRIGHDLAGLAGHLGLSALSRAAVEMNRAGRDGSAGPVAALAAPVLAAGGDAEVALRAAHLAAVRSRNLPEGDSPNV
ncbi:hypothetical protein LNKW23_29630 [Paralimibaculum aggregatum]|uniref:HPt domain-containing protein n=1 Tax=Paralimibaculum aggregatum TaxID=3036245 RepID=A0ABQ6LN87_9RHOB|nr:Hpt domain-containing protein [Limibaculum sp. NKW23]GMG83750.1 hypothetical protein LNKW23_29630 [Limibaculum sp. NKW23]